MNWAATLWLILMIAFLMLEASTVTMVSLWFAAGSLAAMLVAFTGGGLGFQIAVFVIVSAICLASLRPLVRKHFTPKVTKTNVDAIIGSTGLVTVAIDNVAAVGQVKLGAMVWTARSTSGEPIGEGTLIRVDRIEGVKVYVSPVPVPAQV